MEGNKEKFKNDNIYDGTCDLIQNLPDAVKKEVIADTFAYVVPLAKNNEIRALFKRICLHLYIVYIQLSHIAISKPG